MSRGLEILRRLLLAAGALFATIGFIVGAVYAATGTGEDQVGGLVGMIFAPLAFWGYRAAINWILVYEQPPQPPRPPAAL